MTTPEKVAYLRGLADGMEIQPASREGKLLFTVLDILEDLAADVDEISADNGELWEQVDALGSDVNELRIVAERGGFDDYFDEDGDEPDEDEGECACGCGGECACASRADSFDPSMLGDDFTADLVEAADEDTDFDPATRSERPATLYYEVECPVCQEHITIEESVLLQGYINCPKCGEHLEFDMGDEETSGDDYVRDEAEDNE